MSNPCSMAPERVKVDGWKEAESMAIRHYGVLKGPVIRRAFDRDPRTPHYHLLIEAEKRYHAAINMWSSLDHSPLLYCVDTEFEHPLTERFVQLPPGFTDLPCSPNSGALDYIRGELVSRKRFRVAPASRKKEGGLGDILDLYVNRAIAMESASAYVFGTRWGPNPRETDRTFRGFPIHPSDGVHDVHMNQGNPDRPGTRDDQHYRENGTWQDGALLLHFPDDDQWIGIFLAFQSQEWETDDRSGRPVAGTETDSEGRHHRRLPDSRAIRIVAAMVNPVGPAPEEESVTLINTSAELVDLKGWTIVNADQQSTHLSGVIEPRSTRVLHIAKDAPLGNQGGTISLLNARSEKVDGVAYTRGQAAREGRMLTF